MTAASLIPPGPARRRAGTLLLTYGIVGVLLLGSLLVATGVVAFMGRDGFAQVDDTIAQVVAVLDSTTAALDQTDTTLAGVGTSLTETGGVVQEAFALSGIAASGASTLADQIGGFSLLGQNPFSGIEQPLRDISDSLQKLGAPLDAAGAALTKNAEDVIVLADKLGAVSVSLAASRDRIAGVDTQLTGAAMLGFLVIITIIGWLMVPAIAAIWVGRRWRKDNPKA